jgi:hypothetical protein
MTRQAFSPGDAGAPDRAATSSSRNTQGAGQKGSKEAPWQEAKLAQARAKCAELDEKLKASIEPAQASSDGGGFNIGCARRPGAGPPPQTSRGQLPVIPQDHAPDADAPNAARARRARPPATHATAASRDSPRRGAALRPPPANPRLTRSAPKRTPPSRSSPPGSPRWRPTLPRRGSSWNRPGPRRRRLCGRHPWLSPGWPRQRRVRSPCSRHTMRCWTASPLQPPGTDPGARPAPGGKD